MVFEKDGYILYESKKNPNLHFFGKPGNRKGKPIDLPPGFKVKVNKRTGLPMASKIKGKAGSAKKKAAPSKKKAKKKK
jgi:hypothetical protein